MKVNSFISYILAVIVLFMAGCASHLMEAESAYSNRHYSKTITLCRTAIQKDSTDSNAWLLMGRSLTAMNSLYEARRAVEQALKLNPGSGKIKKQLVVIYTGIGDRSKKERNSDTALYYYKKAASLKRKPYTLNHKIADLAFSQGYLAQADEQYKTLAMVFPDSALFQNRLEQIRERTQNAGEQYGKGKTAYDHNYLKTARARLGRALRYKADFEEAKYLNHLTLGRLLYKKGSKNACWEAIDHFGKAMSIKPEKAEPHFYMARTYEKKDRNEFTNAIDEYTTVLKLDPRGPFAVRSQKKLHELKSKKRKYDAFWGK